MERLRQRARGAWWWPTYRYWVADHALVRAVIPNFYKVDDDLYRSSHPGFRRLERAKRLGVRSVLSLRGDPDATPNAREREACARLGLELRFIQLRTVRLPSAEVLLELLGHYRDMPKPMLVHCKSGADRTGLAVTLYRHVIRGEPLEKARRSLHWSYGHLGIGKAGLVHRMLDAYGRDYDATGIPFERWVREVYDPEALAREATG
ncbi:fused DSP-PTPase phosphatase/NAD kinase-like protein [Roseicyclus sp.]|uniref:fused DSP-PTPase phosphatase/NAD kinase-like protein n=1 Tax=Roseicyclus sp. TaxID=1914329 RepID=UPI003F9FB79F